MFDAEQYASRVDCAVKRIDLGGGEALEQYERVTGFTRVAIEGQIGYGLGVITNSTPGNRSMGHLGASHASYRFVRDANRARILE